MLTETRIFTFLSSFLFFLGVVYTVLTGIFTRGVEWSGAVAFIMSGFLSLLIGGYFWFVARRLSGPRPEDDPEATIVDNPEEVGFFSPGSIWPIVVALCILLVGASIALGYFWLLTIAVIALIGAASGLVFEYYRAPAKH